MPLYGTDLTRITFKNQPLATLTKPTPTVDVYYTVLDTVLNARLIALSSCILTTGETIKSRVTVDGVVFGSEAKAQVAGTDYYWFPNNFGSDVAMGYFYASTAAIARAFLLDARSLKIEFCKTTESGTGTLKVTALYAKRV